MSSREQFADEIALRENIRKIIGISRNRKNKATRDIIISELNLRCALQDLIFQETVGLLKEGDKKLYPNTGLNKLSDAFALTIEKIGDKYKALQTNDIQRRAFVVHLEAAFSNLESQLINQDAAADEAEQDLQEEDEMTVKVEKEPFLFNKAEEEPDPEPEETSPSIDGKRGPELKKEIQKFFQEVSPTGENIDDWQEGRERAEEAWAENGWAFAEYFPRSKDDQSMFIKWRKENFKEFYKTWEDEIAGPETVGLDIDNSTPEPEISSELPPAGLGDQEVFSEDGIGSMPSPIYDDTEFREDVEAFIAEEEDFDSFLSRIF